MYSSRNGLPQRLLLATAPTKKQGSGNHHRHHGSPRVVYAPSNPVVSHNSDGADRKSRSYVSEPVFESSRTQAHRDGSGPNSRQHWGIRRPAENYTRSTGDSQQNVAPVPARQSPIAFVASPSALHLGAVGLVGAYVAQHSPQFGVSHALAPSATTTSSHLAFDSSFALSDSLRPGTVVEFHTDGTDHRLGLITKCVDDSGDVFWVSEPASTASPRSAGTSQRMVSNKDVTFVWPRKHRNVVFEYTLDNLPALVRHANHLIAQNRSQMPVVWGSYVDTQRTQITTHSLAEFLFGSQPKPHELYVAHRLLLEHHIYFKSVDRYSYVCRSLSEVHAEKKNAQLKIREDQDIASFVQLLQRRLAETSAARSASVMLQSPTSPAQLTQIEWNPVRDETFINQLKRYALSTSSFPPCESTYASLLKPLSLSRQPDHVFQILVQLGLMNKYENPHLARFHRKLEFDTTELKRYAQTSAILDQSMPLSIPTPSIPSPISLPRLPTSVDRDSGHRRDLRGVGPAFAIDNAAGSDEIDDAIGLEQRSDGSTWVHVHIGDPSRLVAPNDELDLLARERVQSVFLPDRSITMFPPSLARNQFSLLPGKLNFALSYSFCLSNEGEVSEYEITPSVIDQVHCLTYDNADELLKADGATMSSIKRQHAEVLHRMVSLSSRHRSRRLSRGACAVDLPRAELNVMNRGEEIDLKVVRDAHSPSRNMVSEFMIMVGELTAKFARQNNIPIPMRSQASRRTHTKDSTSSSESDVSTEWNFALQQLDQLNRLCPALTDVEPKPHAGLGVDLYCQTTSPIRRYLDLLVQYQIKASLRGESLPFDRKQLRTLIAQVEQVSAELNRLTNVSQRYWMLRYLERQPQGTTFAALVTGTDFSTDPPGSSLLFLDLGWRTSAILERNAMRGELIKLYISFIDPFNDVVSFREIASTDTPTNL